MPHSNQVCILSHVRDNALKNYLGHDIDLSRSRDVIDDVIIRSTIGHFLLEGNWCQASISNRFQDISIQIYNKVTTSPFWIKRCHWPCDHLIPCMPFPIGAQL